MEETPTAEQTPQEQKPTVQAPANEAEAAMRDAGFDASPTSYTGRMLQIAKSMNGWNYISVSRIEKYVNEDQGKLGKTSALVRAIIKNFIFGQIMHKQKPNVDEFVKTFVGQPVIYVQAHKAMPTMAADGVYDAVDINGKTIETRAITEFVLTDEANKAFKPFVLVKSREGIGMIEGNPYHQFSQAEVDLVKEMNKQE